ncbi:MAG TPA: beta-ketoacyl-[acyl-carrier-protein] synthase family protein [Actinocrinis sp.]|nr:beta-ketoacyl-[acyl-carrier-protein] synthase family protein [Actinocrinis sp.]
MSSNSVSFDAAYSNADGSVPGRARGGRGDDEVVVTGVGAITPLGGDAKSTWAAMLAGRGAAESLTEDWAANLPVRFAARAAADPAEGLGRVEARKLDRCEQFSLVALREAWADAGFVGPAEESGTPAADRVGVVIGSGLGGLGSLVANWEALAGRGPRFVSPHTLPMIMANGPAGQASLELGARACAHAPVSACATGAEAVAAGLDLIRLGRADVVVAGGTEAIIHPLALASFATMLAMSRRNDDPARASRPFDRGRDGFVMGEGAGMLVLESARHAEARGAHVYCELAGAGVSADAHHIASPEPEGRGMAAALRKALADARLDVSDIVHVNAHATSTQQGDLAESRAMAAVLGCAPLPEGAPAGAGYCVSATKSMSGHLIGAAGALEAVATVLALRDRLAPPTINLEDPDPRIEVDVVHGRPRALPAGRIAALSNSSGFGGHNVVLAFSGPGRGRAR